MADALAALRALTEGRPAGRDSSTA
jgi:hypothetical protein